jgi:hypothetical protein
MAKLVNRGVTPRAALGQHGVDGVSTRRAREQSGQVGAMVAVQLRPEQAGADDEQDVVGGVQADVVRISLGGANRDGGLLGVRDRDLGGGALMPAVDRVGTVDRRDVRLSVGVVNCHCGMDRTVPAAAVGRRLRVAPQRCHWARCGRSPTSGADDDEATTRVVTGCRGRETAAEQLATFESRAERTRGRIQRTEQGLDRVNRDEMVRLEGVDAGYKGR